MKSVLTRQSHYKFKECLKAEAKKYRTNVYDTTEEFTSQMCTKCGELSKVYERRIKKCKCGFRIDRDINGSRNILIKCMREKKIRKESGSDDKDR